MQPRFVLGDQRVAGWKAGLAGRKVGLVAQKGSLTGLRVDLVAREVVPGSRRAAPKGGLVGYLADLAGRRVVPDFLKVAQNKRIPDHQRPKVVLDEVVLAGLLADQENFDL